MEKKLYEVYVHVNTLEYEEHFILAESESKVKDYIDDYYGVDYNLVLNYKEIIYINEVTECGIIFSKK